MPPEKVKMTILTTEVFVASRFTVVDQHLKKVCFSPFVDKEYLLTFCQIELKVIITLPICDSRRQNTEAIRQLKTGEQALEDDPLTNCKPYSVAVVYHGHADGHLQ